MKQIICFLLLIFNTSVFSQTDKLGQFWNEYVFTKDLSQKWSIEVDAGLNSSSTPQDKNMFHNVTQVYFRGWAHYYMVERWKVSVFYAYYFNKNVPELNQKNASESRTAVQATYNLVKLPKIKINLRGRFEDRHIENDDNYIEAVQRFRFQVKAVYPINENTFYVFASDELFFKTKSKVCGPDFFDRNRVSLGLGFAVSDNIQIEAAYANEIMPRDGNDKLVNAFQLKGIFNNFFSTIIKSYKRKKNEVDISEGRI
ncbi:DUF2490 domain-containing protein [Flavobacterium chryseum]|uniref:DUF2490 domain-containing protein n=1 Tax=Flavobacterium sp. P3160 TaxID=2512113 RepID=UPI00105C3FF1|nr:DUF2490 domain-containing protein [Flavobacterium sp. P3160]